MRATFSLGGARERLSEQAREARKALAKAVLDDCAAHVPRDSGTLAASGRAVEGAVEYTALYAKNVYYKQNNWFEEAKATNAGKWTQVAQEAMRGGRGR